MPRGVWRAAGVLAAVAGPLVVAGAVFPDDYDIELSYGCPASHPLRVYTSPAHMSIALGAVDNSIPTIATYCCDPGPASCDMNFFMNYDGDRSQAIIDAKHPECTWPQRNIIARNVGVGTAPANRDSLWSISFGSGESSFEKERALASSCYRGSPCDVLIARPKFEHELAGTGGLFYTDCDTNGPWGTVCYSTPRAGKARASLKGVFDDGKAYDVPITSRYFESWFANATDYSDECMLSGSDLVASVSGGLTLAGITAYSATN